MKKIIVVILVSLLITSCSVTTEQIRNANYGNKPTKEMLTGYLGNYLNNNLIDPYSVKTKCSRVVKGWARHSAISAPNFGYFTFCEVNAKNRFGGYAGAKPYIVITKPNGGYRIITNPVLADSKGLLFDF